MACQFKTKKWASNCPPCLAGSAASALKASSLKCCCSNFLETFWQSGLTCRMEYNTLKQNQDE